MGYQISISAELAQIEIPWIIRPIELAATTSATIFTSGTEIQRKNLQDGSVNLFLFVAYLIVQEEIRCTET